MFKKVGLQIFKQNQFIKTFSTINKQKNNTELLRQQQQQIKKTFFGGAIGSGILGYLIAFYTSQNEKPTDIQEEQNENLKEQEQEDIYDGTTKILNKGNMLQFNKEWNYNWDGKQDLANPDGTKTQRGTKYITLIRHGQYNTQAENSEDKILTKLGETQANQVGNQLKKIGINFDQIYVSDMIRSKQTGNIIAKNINQAQKIQEDPLLAEGFPCPVSPLTKPNINEKYKKEKDGKRISDAFEKYFHRCDTEEDQHQLFVIHANVIRYFVARALQFPVEGWLRMSHAHCGITQIEIRQDGTVSLVSFGDSGHMKKDQVTTM
ncbi:hypothetical protein PPERSA_09570 [Pseudocohnilembus persalinus]|uniref:Serine/threonine-protein phosphatase PGAM5, mitochondrial n=1 Tax=Pseudocohnilembus persalinus TaxID=266149 RepID=A0A0V0QFJ8_PSEPJ|nr:hypothetical protein PPERSA_09570 [Pseudocohnilembus persalinus]|eukprot:KRX00964.1 hypothetical protein PPERSA_09570 [Pseudocohnilembus persalinus]